MTVRITAEARTQYLDTIRHYLVATDKRPPRPEAARKLTDAYAKALRRIAAGPDIWHSHPRPYPDLARYGFRWIKIHRYWFAYIPAPDPIITNILDATADIPARVSRRREPQDP